jgi:dethiobiotin synthetase
LDQPRIIFITGTDTGVGKTILTALLLSHLRSLGCPALALKPFCCGSRADAHLFHRLQAGALTLDQINPFHFPEPLAPLVAARQQHRLITLQDVLGHVHSFGSSPVLLIEGAGGVLAPLGEGFCALDLIARLRCEVIVVSRNKLGTINHTLLTVRALQTPITPRAKPAAGPPRLTVLLMSARHPDPSAASNPELLSESLAPVPVFDFPFLGPGCRPPALLRAHAKKQKPLLSRILRELD